MTRTTTAHLLSRKPIDLRFLVAPLFAICVGVGSHARTAAAQGLSEVEDPYRSISAKPVPFDTPLRQAQWLLRTNGYT